MFYKEIDFREATVIGKIPVDWEIVRIEEVCESKRGFSYRSDQITKEPTGMQFITINDFEKEGGFKQNGEKLYLKDDVNVDSDFFLDKDDVLIANTDMSRGFIIGAPVHIENIEGKFVYSMDLTKLIFDKKRMIGKFLFYFLKHEKVRSKMKTFAQGTNVLHFNHGLMKNLQIPLPPPEEQRAVVGVLGVVDSAILKVDEVIWKTERLKKGLMQQLLTRGIGHKEYKDTPIEKIPKEWDVKRLEEASMEVTIGVVNPATPYYTSANDGVPYFRSQNVRENRLEPTNVYVRPEFNERHPRSILKENDILTLQTGFIGVSCIVPKEYEGANCHSLLITRTNPKMLNPQFLCQFLNSAVGKKIINRHNSGWGRAHLLLEDFRRISIPLPPLQEQQTIAEILSTIDKRIKLERKEKTRLERIKRGLMDLLLTGKVRVRVD
jgi:type I restriction enzyme S subunit